jgi:hypothetical protein
MQKLMGWSDQEKERQIQEHNSVASLAQRFKRNA